MGLLNRIRKPCCHRHKSRGMSNWIIRRASKRLKLDDTQQNKLVNFQNTLVNSRTYVANVHQDRDQLFEGVFPGNEFDRDMALHYLAVPRLAFAEQAPAIVDAFDDLYRSLNAEQKGRLRSWLLKYQPSKFHC